MYIYIYINVFRWLSPCLLTLCMVSSLASCDISENILFQKKGLECFRDQMQLDSCTKARLFWLFWTGKIVYLPLPGDDPKQRRPNITRARKLLDWEPKAMKGVRILVLWISVVLLCAWSQRRRAEGRTARRLAEDYWVLQGRPSMWEQGQERRLMCIITYSLLILVCVAENSCSLYSTGPCEAASSCHGYRAVSPWHVSPECKGSGPEEVQ